MIKTPPPVRAIAYATRGRTSGPITRLVSPSDLGEVMKPFVFLDFAYFDRRAKPTPMEYFWHPHSGIATVTVPLDGAIRIADTTGTDVVLPAGGIEWMRAHGACRAIAIEANDSRQRLIEYNRDALGVPGLPLVRGEAPGALDGLPAPDAVFIGGGLTAPGLLDEPGHPERRRARGVRVAEDVLVEDRGVP